MYHILIVDEEEHLLWALERNLFPDRNDVQVHTAGSGEEGLDILADEPIDLLISDIKMPGEVDGFQLILRAKEMVPDAVVMIITAFGTHRIQNFAERIGISHYIEKPFTVDELRSAVLEVLDEQEGFQGVLSDLELTDIIQMLCLAKRTALLHLKHRDRRGRIVFDAGDVVHAEFDGTIGAEAVYEMLQLRQGDIFMQSDFEPVDRSIDIGWQDLLLEGVKRTDEQRLEEQREQTRREMGIGDSQADGGADSPSDPAGMGVTASDGDVSEETSGGMLFSEEDLEEISRASEAAIEEETEDAVGEADASEPVDGGDDDGESSKEQAPHSPESDPTSVEAFAAPSPGGSNSDAMGRPPAEKVDTEVAAAAVEPDGEAVPPVGSSGPFASVVERTETRSRDDDSQKKRDRSDTSPGMRPAGFESDTEEADSDVTSAGDTADGAPLASDSSEVETDEEVDVRQSKSADKSSGEPTTEDGFGRPDSDTAQQNGPLSASIQRFVSECPGVQATGVLSIDEMQIIEWSPVDADSTVDKNKLADRLAAMFAGAGRCVGIVDHEDRVREMQLVLDGQYVLLHALDDADRIHVAVVEREVNLGVALVLMRETARRYAQ